MRCHGAVASLEMEGSLVDAVNRDWRSAPVNPRVRAALGWLETLTLDPEGLDAAAATARAAGLSDDALEDAAFVGVLFNTYVRLADTFEFELPTVKGLAFSAKMLMGEGYNFPPPLRWFIRDR